MAKTNAHAPALAGPAGGVKEPPRGITAERVNALVEENRRLRRAASQMDAAIMFRRLDYLFMVVRSAERFNPDFVSGCVSEIEAALAAPGRPLEGVRPGDGANDGGDGGGEEG